MKKGGGITALTALLLAALLLGGLPVPRAFAESGADSVGAAITIGLMAAVVVTYGLVALRSDVERLTSAPPEDAIQRAARAVEQSPLVLQTITAPLALEGAGPNAAPPQVAGAAVGWRFHF